MRDVRCLAQFPYVLVRVACDFCPNRRGSYRLARLAEKMGADTPIEDMLARIAFDCPYPSPHKARGNQYHPRCHVHFPDLMRPNPWPPDLPAGAQPLKVITGGKR